MLVAEDSLEHGRGISGLLSKSDESEVGVLGGGCVELDVEAGLAQVERDTLSGQLHGAGTFHLQREGWRRDSPTELLGFVQIALCGKEECVARARLRKKARCDLAFFLEDDICERSAIDGLGDG